MEKLKILLLCTDNACRSQMAEGWMRHLANDLYQVQSAGIEAHGQNANTIAVMQEVGIDVSHQPSAMVTAEMLQWADLLVTFCDNADQQCPVVNDDCIRMHLPLPDPAKFKGSAQEVLHEFRATCDEIKKRALFVLEQLHPELSAELA